METVRNMFLKSVMVISLIASIVFPLSVLNLPHWCGYLYIPIIVVLTLILKENQSKIISTLSILWVALWALGIHNIASGIAHTSQVFNVVYYIVFGIYILHLVFLFNDVYE